MKVLTFLACFLCFTSVNPLSAQNLRLGDVIWWDKNDNGIKEADDIPANGIGVILYLDNNDDGIADAGFTPLNTSTNYLGKFQFTNLAAGKYFLRIDAGWGHYKSTRYGGDPDNDIIGDNNAFTQDLTTFFIKTETIHLLPGSEPDGTGATNTDTNNSMGIAFWKYNGLGDMVWLDNNQNGIYDSGETGMANVTVNLRNTSGGLLATTTTDANGNYYFYDPMGYYGTNNYQVEFITPTGFVATSSNIGSNDDLDSDPVNGIISSINVPQGFWNHSFDAGFRPGFVLPLTFINFQALLKENKVEIKWSAVNEINVSHFIVEKSLDGKFFTNIGMIFSTNNNTSTYGYYSFNDVIGNPVKGSIYFYRIRSVDHNGINQLTEIRKVVVANAAENDIGITTFPNPAVHEVNIKIPNDWQSKKVVYEIISTSGVTIYKQEIPVARQVLSIPVAQLSKGIYYAKATCEGKTAIQKFLK